MLRWTLLGDWLILFDASYLLPLSLTWGSMWKLIRRETWNPLIDRIHNKLSYRKMNQIFFSGHRFYNLIVFFEILILTSLGDGGGG
ncbi:hypothetical protein Lal_00003457 [Lupinus albus]|nr:hypothetical protein Lal_00003457 [Lupinus albus]